MSWKRHSPEEIVTKLTAVRSAVATGIPMADAVKSVGVSESTYFRWSAQYGDLNVDQLQLIKRLELENARLRKALGEFEHGLTA